MKNYVLGYGSLINLKSLSRTIKREASTNDIIPVKLHSFKRKWNLKEKVHSSALNDTINAIFLNIERDDARWTNGVIFEVSNDELEYLNKRERKYNQLNVAQHIELYSGNKLDSTNVTTYVADEIEYLQSDFTDNSYVMENYLKIVKQGCMDLGFEFYSDYIKTTDKFKFNILKGDYKFV
jgi:cation transport regulator ChaC